MSGVFLQIQSHLNFGCRLSGLLTARFLLHVRRWDARDDKVTTVETPMTFAPSQDPPAFSTVPEPFTLGGSSTVLASVASNFGSDPIARANAGWSSLEDVEQGRHPEQTVSNTLSNRNRDNHGSDIERVQDNQAEQFEGVSAV